MPEIETQVVKIQLGDTKQATSYVFTLAEKIPAEDIELFVICELPVFNPAAITECKKIAESVAATLKRSYKKLGTDIGFDEALAEVNDELGKLVSMGKSHWVGKLNAVIAVQRKQKLSIAAVGKISAQLLRDGKFVSVVEPSNSKHVLKTFENFSEGRLQLGDILVLSSTQLFNHISADRISKILNSKELKEASAEIIDTLHELMGPESACGTILAMQAEIAETDSTEDVIDLNTYLGGPKIISEEKTSTATEKVKSAANFGAVVGKSVWQSVKNKLSNKAAVKASLRNQVSKISSAHDQFKQSTGKLRYSYISSLPRSKKIFLISLTVLAVALVANIFIARVYQKSKEEAPQPVALEQMQKLANDANAALLYGDETQATNILAELQTLINNATKVPEEQVAEFEKIKQSAKDLAQKIDKVTVVQTENVGVLGNADRLISLPEFIATEASRTILSFNTSTREIKDNALRSSEPITASSFIGGSKVAIYNGKELMLWDYKTGIVGGAFSEQLPSGSNLVGPKAYPANKRVYIIDKLNKQILGYPSTDDGYSAPVSSLKDAPELALASDFAIDGNIYILSNGQITKYNSGKKQDFSLQMKDISNNSQIYTELEFKYLYVLDKDNQRIGVLNKDGSVAKMLTSEQFKDLKDFVVDEKNGFIYLLSGNNLLRLKI